MNIKRYISSAIILLLFIFLYELLVHGVLLINIYSMTPTIWRQASEMIAKTPFNILVQVGLAAWLAFIFTKLFPQGGWKNGFYFGCYFGVLSALQAVGIYYWLPISIQLASLWFIANLAECVLGGTLLGIIYRNP